MLSMMPLIAVMIMTLTLMVMPVVPMSTTLGGAALGRVGVKAKLRLLTLSRVSGGFGAQLLCPMFGLSGVAWTNGSGWGVGVRLV